MRVEHQLPVVAYLKEPGTQRRAPQQAAHVGSARNAEIEQTVSDMLRRIERRGLSAVREYSQQLDGWNPTSFRVSQAAIDEARASVDPALAGHIEFAQQQVENFARHQRDSLQNLAVETRPGVRLGHRHVAVDSVGSYVPAGQYPLLASAFMTVRVPKVAGVGRVVGCSPPSGPNGIDPAVLYSIVTSGADEVFCLGGVQAVAALALGLEDLEPVDMVVGPGNAYVTEAKRQLFGRVGIDVLAGPSEVLIIADDSASAEILAIDLLAQAEHGPTSAAVLVSTSRTLARDTEIEVERLLAALPVEHVTRTAWRDHGAIVVAASAEDALEYANGYASEHVQVHVGDESLDYYHDGLRHYGSLFLGRPATVVYGDKAIGTNHVLPTGGAARFTGGLWVGTFLKTLTFQRVTLEGARSVAPAAAAIADAESLQGHAASARRRLEDQLI